MTPPLLELRSVSAGVRTRDSVVPILRDIDLTIDRGEIVGLVGESGSGKSMTARTIVRSLPAGAEVSGSVLLDGHDLLAMRPRDLRKLRATRMAMIFQDPRSGVDPLWTIEDHLTEGMRVHDRMSRPEARARAVELLARVGIRDGARRLSQYPHELSGGLLQRVVIAGALAGDPDLIIADEPTTALDVTSQADTVAIFAELRRERGLGMLFVTHDLALAATLCDRIVVMYAGKVLETNARDGILTRPVHPYTAALVAARPRLETRAEMLAVIPGQPTSAALAPSGCPFRPRCNHAQDECATADMQLRPFDGGMTACVRAEELAHG